MSRRVITFSDGTKVRVEGGSDAWPPDELALSNLVRCPAGAAVLGPWNKPGGPAAGGDAGLGLHASYELLRRTVNGLVEIVDGAFIGHNHRSYGGNIVVHNRTRSTNQLGQHLVDPPDGDDRPIPSAVEFSQAIQSTGQSVTLNRPAFVVERSLWGSVTAATPLMAFRKRFGDGGTDTGPYIGDDRTEKWLVLDDGTYFTRGGLFVMGDDANVIVRGGSAYIEYGAVVAVLGPGTNADDASGTSLAMARTSGTGAQIGDIYGNSVDLVITGATSTFRVPRVIVSEIATPSTPASGFLTIYAKSDSNLYCLNDAGTEFKLTPAGASGTEFEDDVFRINDEGDPTKQLAFSVGGITTLTTRTLTAPDADGTLPLLERDETWTGEQLFTSATGTWCERSNAADNTVLRVLALRRRTTVTAAAGLGVSMDAYLENAAGTSVQAGVWETVWTDAGATYDADMIFKLASGGSVGERFRITGAGAWSFSGSDLTFRAAAAQTGTLTWTPVTSSKTITLPNITGTVALTAATAGGTAQTTYAEGDLLYASAVDTLAKLAAGTDGHVLTLASGLPSWASSALKALKSEDSASAASMSYTVPGGTLAADNDVLLVFAAGSHDDTEGVQILLEGETILATASLVTGSWFAVALVRRTSATTCASSGALFHSTAGVAVVASRNTLAVTLANDAALVASFVAQDAGDVISFLHATKIGAP